MNDSPGPPTGTRAARLTVRRNFVWMLAGLGAWSVYQAATLVLLARLGSPEVVGEYALGLAVAAPVFMFANLNLRAVQATDAADAFAFHEYLAVRVASVAAALGALTAFAFLVYAGRGAETIVAVGFSKAIESLSDIYYGLYQREERLDRVTVSVVLRGALGLPALAAAMALTGRVQAAVVALGVGWLVVLLAHDVPCERRLTGSRRSSWRAVLDALGRRRTRRNLIAASRRLALLSLPLGVAASVTSLMANVPRYFVEERLGTAALGVFAVLCYPRLALGRVVDAAARSAAARFGQHIRDGARAALARLVASAAAVTGLLGALAAGGAWLLGEPVLAFVFGPEYAAEWRVFVWLIAVATVEVVVAFPRLALTAARKLRVQALTELITLGAVAAGCALWVGPHGLLGATWAIGVAALVRMAADFGALYVAVVRGSHDGTPAHSEPAAPTPAS
jgi:O-antigen/teichoic acid export membrane protein